MIKSILFCLMTLPNSNQIKECINLFKYSDENIAYHLAIAKHESDFNDVISNGNYGIMQIKPKYWCQDKCLSYTIAGINAFNILLKRFRKPKKALCHYNRGNLCDDKGKRYADVVYQKALKFKRILNDLDRSYMLIYLDHLSLNLSLFLSVLERSSHCNCKSFCLNSK